ncbi:glycosyltransferase family 2 protein [Psychroserpens burtonensis]|uniref:Glycosyltransferase family 2 protein n=1 Tax=Psychroserpens burtonensis TaxID=49278 RepID=A0A5C7B5S4_9FLAO|nr:glycosyltransferase family A protein [Psychroserpens burtonensis]TXE17111.1 glycosyltransferase family 2 protein [Psychroserpens burtonensis]
MSLSIITPHYNEFEGLKRIYNCLLEQTDKGWEWIVVDDFSDNNIVLKIDEWINDINEKRIRFIKNASKTNGSVCRNQGAKASYYNNLVFLDADDYIAEDFVLNRDVDFEEFAIFKNNAIVDKNGTQERRPELGGNYLNQFLNAKFIWQTTAVLWNKSFFMKIGQFEPNLERLQDVELTIRALFIGTNYKVIDNEVDFYYCVKPIRLKQDIVRKSCESVRFLILKIHSAYSLDIRKQGLLKSYYYACVKNLHRSKNRQDVVYLKESLKLFYTKHYINVIQYFLGFALLMLYKYHLISDSLFIKTNRYFFK